MADINGMYDTDAEASKDFGKLPTGEYLVRICDSDVKPTNDNTGEYIELVYEVLEGDYKGRKLWDKLNVRNKNETAQRISNENFAAVRAATGVLTPKKTEELHNKPLVIRVEFFPQGSEITYGQKKGQKRDRDENQIKAWKKHDGAVPMSAAPAPSQSSSSARPPWDRAA